jgi:hypothetical protein
LRIDRVQRDAVVRPIAAGQQRYGLPCKWKVIAQVDVVDVRDSDALNLLAVQIEYPQRIRTGFHRADDAALRGIGRMNPNCRVILAARSSDGLNAWHDAYRRHRARFERLEPQRAISCLFIADFRHDQPACRLHQVPHYSARSLRQARAAIWRRWINRRYSPLLVRHTPRSQNQQGDDELHSMARSALLATKRVNRPKFIVTFHGQRLTQASR